MGLIRSKEDIVLSYRWENSTIAQNLPFNEQKFLLIKMRPINIPPQPRVNLILVLDKSSSMEGEPLENLKKAVKEIVQILDEEDRTSIVLFDSEARTIVSNSPTSQRKEIVSRIEDIFPLGGTCIDEGIATGIEESEKLQSESIIKWMILLTDGKNEHGNNDRCLDLARIAKRNGLSITTLGLGRKWDPRLLEQIADISGGKMYYVENPKELKDRFISEFRSIKNIAYKDLSLKVKLEKFARLSDISPAFIITPQIKKIEPLWDGEQWIIEGGNLEREKEKLILLQMFISAPESSYINKVLEYIIEYRTIFGEKLESSAHNVVLEVTESYVSQFDEEVRDALQKVSLYVQQELAEKLIDEGKPLEALTVLQTMVQTAIKFEDGDLKNLIEENIQKVKADGTLPDELRIKTKYETKMVDE